MEKFRKHQSAREEKMYEPTTTAEFQSVVNTFRLCSPKQEMREIGYCPLRLGVKTVGVKEGFYQEVLQNSCRVKVSAVDAFRYLWRTRNQVSFDIFSQN
jgi:hypothetical protein